MPIVLPSLADIRARTRISATTYPDELLGPIVEAEAQAMVCRLPDLPEPDVDVELPALLAQALYRRVRVAVARDQVPLGYLGLDQSEYGPARMGSRDPEVLRLEAPYRIPVVA